MSKVFFIAFYLTAMCVTGVAYGDNTKLIFCDIQSSYISTEGASAAYNGSVGYLHCNKVNDKYFLDAYNCANPYMYTAYCVYSGLNGGTTTSYFSAGCSCNKCDGGYYRHYTGSSVINNNSEEKLYNCYVCEDGYYSNGTDTSCTACTNGPSSNAHYTSKASSNACPWECDEGYSKYDDSLLGWSCAKCSVGKYFDSSSGCVSCGDGYYAKKTNDTTYAQTGNIGLNDACGLCPVGTKQTKADDNAPTCTVCPKGQTSYNSNCGATSCGLCPNNDKIFALSDGTWSHENPNGVVKSNCTDNHPGTNCMWYTVDEYEEVGTFSAVSGTLSKSACAVKTCGYGTYKSGNTTCSKCYNLGKKKLYMYTDGPGKTSSSSCFAKVPAGYYIANAKDDVFTRCEAGYKCPAHTVNYGSTSSASQRVKCSAGTVSSAGAAACTACTKGHYQPNPGEDSCLECQAGTYQDKTGQTSCTKCAAGKYGAGTAKESESMACTACVEGSYTSSTGQTECSPCQNGKTTSGAGQTKCNAECLGNKQASYVKSWQSAIWSNNIISLLCEVYECESLTAGDGVESAVINISSDKKTCIPSVSCKGGYHTPTPSSNTVTKPDAASCTGCAAGYYCTGGTASQTSCNDNYYSGAGASSCTACPNTYPKSDAGGGAAKSINACYLTLSAGYYVATVTKGQVACKAGSYCPGCTNPTGTWTMGGNDATKCETNSKIYYGTGYGSDKTTGGAHDCYVGTYGAGASTERQKPSHCTPCAGGASTSSTGSTKSEQCHLTGSTEFCDSKRCFTLPFFDDLIKANTPVKQKKE